MGAGPARHPDSTIILTGRSCRLMYRRFGRGLSQLSRRSLVLFSIGLAWIVYGYAIFTIPLDAISQDAGHTIPLTQLLTIRWSGILWVLSGAVGVTISALRRRRSHRVDAWGFNSLLIPPLLWTLLSTWTWVVYLVTDGHLGRSRGWVSALVWAAMAIWVFITAGWADPVELPKETQRSTQPDGD